ncbi:ABC transporter ATP-binding protein [Leucobacter allii]|uniref:ABC transporter ATP-binding protein n=1 Tax=Leucobacter allii TaxID=2932247 RepID=A0ABY4FLE1_9MICO|nr:ABC transporter ATP-binding protein [Leucobacter allii]UOQ57093.1 ABC transporter ATP-binding protein [Leucobacter allii]
MGGIAIEGLAKTFNSTRVLHSIDLRIERGEFITLLGPSGCGKTTTLRCVAGLETPSAGRIRIGEDTVVDSELADFTPPHRRRVGMVFQSYAIWPHMSARANVEFPLRRRKQGSRAEQRAIAARALESVGMSAYAERYPHELSGGQQQRIALARGLVAAGEVMLYDEPLSNLDAKLRVAMRDEVRRLHDEFGHTSIYVTHDQEEALAISDRIVIMNAGRIEQSGTPQEIFDAPTTRYVADFIGFENILTVEEASGGIAVAGGIRFSGLPDARPGDALAFRSGAVSPGAHDDAAATFDAPVAREVYLGEDVVLHLEVAGGPGVVARIPAQRRAQGLPERFHVDAADIAVLTA